MNYLNSNHEVCITGITNFNSGSSSVYWFNTELPSNKKVDIEQAIDEVSPVAWSLMASSPSSFLFKYNFTMLLKDNFSFNASIKG